MSAAAATVGIVGGGQLAQMAHLAAIPLGVEVIVLSPTFADPAVRAGAAHLPGLPDRYDDLATFAARCDVITLDHERTPAEVLQRLHDAGHRVAPGAAAARVGRDKHAARELARELGIGVAPFTVTDDVEQVGWFGAANGWPLHLKRTTGGYDGRGVWPARTPGDVRRAFHDAACPLLVEPTLALDREVSAIVARSWSGEVVTYPLIETVQVDGTCREAFLPSGASEALAAEADQIARSLAEAVGLVGVMAVELFVVDGHLLLNELAVRPHNSGHLTIEACTTSQFENHLRAVLDLPLGSTARRVPAAAMVNVLGRDDGSDPFDRIAGALRVDGATIHRYGKAPIARRKLGHVTATGDDVDEARTIANRSVAALVAEAVA